MALTPERLRELLTYEKSTGLFRYNVRRGGMQPGDVAGYAHPDGYVAIELCGKQYLAHRLAWFYVTGQWPANKIDHKNRVRNDNRWRNLRAATDCENGYNRTMRETAGAYRNGNTWYSKIRVGKKVIYLGVFQDATAAANAYRKAKDTYHGDYSGK